MTEEQQRAVDTVDKAIISLLMRAVVRQVRW